MTHKNSTRFAVATTAALTATLVAATAVAAAPVDSTDSPLPSPIADTSGLPSDEALATEPDTRVIDTRISSTQRVTSTKDSGSGSLRTAIKRANKRGAGSTTQIVFAVSGTITLKSDLPAIVRRVVIDGTSAPGYVAGGAPAVGLNANDHRAVRFAPGSDNSQLLALSVTKASGNGVTLTASKITLNYNYIGLTASGQTTGNRGDLAASSSGNRGDGIYIERTSRKNTIGINPTLTPGATANVISNNRGAGIRAIGSSGNVIHANRIGTNPAGTKAAGNQHGGIELIGSKRNKIGGSAIGSNDDGPNDPTGDKGTVPENYVAPPQGNLISGNKRDGVLITDGSKKSLLRGNFIGTNAAGVKAIANKGNGIRVIESDGTVLRGCTVTDNPFVYYNVVSGNKKNGLHVTDSDKTDVQANFFGIGMDNTTTVANKLNGMLFDGNSKKPHVGGVIPLGNVAAGNGLNGIEVKDTVSGFETFNTFGGLLAFKGAAPNKKNGLLVTSTGGDNLARTNVFSGNRGNGIKLAGNVTGMTIDPNIVGLNTKGDGPLRNTGHGVLVTGNARKNTIGGNRVSVIPQNTLSGNVGYGLVFAKNARNNKVYNTYVGSGAGLTIAVPNLKGGVLLKGKARDNYIGATGSQKVNVFGGNIGYGIVLRSKTSDNAVINNNIGKGRVGEPLPNTVGNISNSGSKNVIRDNNLG